MVAEGTPRELIAQSSATQSVTLVTAQPLDAGQLGRIPGVEELACDGVVARFRVRNATPALAALTQWLAERKVEIMDLQVRKASLEDVFLRLTRRETKEPAA